MNNRSLSEKHIIVLGNKKYDKLDITSIVDQFTNIYRCNLGGIPNKNGNMYGNLVLCNHIYEALVTRPLNKQQFVNQYKSACDEKYLNDFYTLYQNNKEKFLSISYIHPNSTEYNQMLRGYNSPVEFVSRPRTGLAVIFHCLKKYPNHKIIAAGFSMKQEPRRSFYVKENYDETASHHPKSEIEILRYLHSCNIIDASLCMLEDINEYSFEKTELKPTKFMMEMIKQ